MTAPAPLFTSLLNYRHSRPRRGRGPGRLAGIEVLSGRERTNYPLTVSVDDAGTGLGFAVLAVAPIDPGLVCGLLEAAAGGLVGRPGAGPGWPRCTGCRCWARRNSRQVLAGWNDTAREVPAGTLPGLFAAQAAAGARMRWRSRRDAWC